MRKLCFVGLDKKWPKVLVWKCVKVEVCSSRMCLKCDNLKCVLPGYV